MKKLFILIVFVFLLVGCNNQPTPVLNPGVDTIEVGDSWSDAGARLRVGYDYYPMSTLDIVDINTIGFYDILYTVVYEEIEYFITRRVAVVEKKSFNAEILPGVDTLLVGEEWFDAGVNAPFGSEITINSEVDTSTTGTYIVEYIISYEGKEVILYRYVNVI